MANLRLGKTASLAWRNLWRNKWRTMITVASVFFGVLLSTVMSSMQEGSYSSMIDNVVKLYSGYIQVHHEDYWENKTINNVFEVTDSLIREIESVKEITHYAPRLESFALGSSEEITRGTMVIGIDPEAEDRITEVSKWIIEGKYLDQDDAGVLIASDLAKYLNLGVNDTLVLLSQGYHGVSAAGKYPIRGILKFPSPELNKQTVYMPLAEAQYFYFTENSVTALVLMIEDQYHLNAAMNHLRSRIGSPYKAMTWSEMQPEIVQMIEADRGGAIIMKAILYILIGFGIFGTVMMMMAERRRELGVMIAIGMQKGRLSIILLCETLFIGFIGVVAGFIGSVPIIAYFYKNPIVLTGDAGQTMEEMGFEPLMYFSWIPSVFYNQVITVFCLTAVIALYPIINTYLLKVHLALHGS